MYYAFLYEVQLETKERHVEGGEMIREGGGGTGTE
jgi:hypothetical protein